jgi:hypothetical protein
MSDIILRYEKVQEVEGELTFTMAMSTALMPRAMLLMMLPIVI